MNNRIRLTVIALHVIAALNILLMVLLVMFAFQYMQVHSRSAFVWKVATIGVTLTIVAETVAWALKKEKKWAWVLALLFCSLNLPVLLLSLGRVSLSGSEGTMALVCRSGFVDCTGISPAQLCKSAEMNCELMQVSPDVNPDRNEIQTFNIHIGDHVGPDKPAPGAGRMTRPGTIHRYLFTAAPKTRFAFKPETPCTIHAGWELEGSSPMGGQTIGVDQMCAGSNDHLLEYGGPYSIEIHSSEAGEYAFTLVQLTDGVQDYTLNIGDLVAPDKPASGAGRIEAPGSQDRYTFTAEAGMVIEIQRKPPCRGQFMITESDNPDYHSLMDCSGPNSIRAKRAGAYTFLVSDSNGEIGDYSFKLKLEDQLVSFPNGIKCYKPVEYDKTNSPGLTVKVKEIVDLQMKNEQKAERLVQLSIEKDDIDAQRYRVCEEHGNGITDKETYAKQRETIQSWRKASWAALKLR